MISDRRIRVLVCEDEAVTMMQLRQALERGGFEVVGETMEGEQAYRMACDLKPDIVLMDINIQGISGVEATRKIMDHSPTAVIMLTAYSDDHTVNKAMEAGASCYLVKPIIGEQLIPAARTAFGRFEAMRSAISENLDLKEQLVTRKLVERAKGILMARMSLTDEQALDKICAMSAEKGIPVKDVAMSIVDAESVLF